MNTHPSLLIHQQDQIELVLTALATLEPNQHHGAQARALRELLTDRIKEDSAKKAQRYREAAQREWTRDGELEIDDGAPVSMGDDPGAYVQAWVWISNDQAGVEDSNET